MVQEREGKVWESETRERAGSHEEGFKGGEINPSSSYQRGTQGGYARHGAAAGTATMANGGMRKGGHNVATLRGLVRRYEGYVREWVERERGTEEDQSLSFVQTVTWTTSYRAFSYGAAGYLKLEYRYDAMTRLWVGPPPSG